MEVVKFARVDQADASREVEVAHSPTGAVRVATEVLAGAGERPLPKSQFDRIGPDPFGLRSPPPVKPRISGDYHPAQYQALFSALDMVNPTGDVPPPSLDTPPNSVPKIAHFIWIGSDFTNIEFRSNVEKWHTNRPELQIILWTDQRDMTKETKEWCTRFNIKLVHIDDVFSGEYSMECDREYRLERGKIPPNWGAATDILRYNILYKFGGIYSDVDLRASLLKLPYESDGDMYMLQGANDYFMSPPKHPLFNRALNEMGRRYQKTKHDLCDVEMGAISPTVTETSFRTGPDLIHQIAKTTTKIKTLPRSKGNGSALTWIAEPFEMTPNSAEYPDKRALYRSLVTNIMYNLRNDPQTLDIAVYTPYIRLFPDPAAIEREMLSLITTLQPELLGGIEHFYALFPSSITALESQLGRELMDEETLEHAAQYGNLEVVEYAIEERKISPTLSSCNSAASSGNIPMLEALISHIDLESSGIFKPVQVAKHYPPIISAAARGHTEVVRYLLGRGASLSTLSYTGDPLPIESDESLRAALPFPKCRRLIYNTLTGNPDLDQELPLENLLDTVKDQLDDTFSERLIDSFGEALISTRDSLGRNLFWHLLNSTTDQEGPFILLIKKFQDSPALRAALEDIGGGISAHQFFKDKVREDGSRSDWYVSLSYRADLVECFKDTPI